MAFAWAPVVAPALAQDEEPRPGPPIRLVPSPPVRERAAPREAAAPAGITETTLAPLDRGPGDAQGNDEAAAPRDLWRGTSPDILRAMLRQLAPTRSPALRALARRLLLNGGAIPGAGEPADGAGLFLLRAQALARLGALGGAASVLDNAPGAPRGDAEQRFRIELAFAANDSADACRRVAAGMRQHEGAWWDEATIACDLVAGAREKAALARDVLRDRDPAPDALFDTLLAAADGAAGARLDRHAVLTPLRATLWALSQRPLPADVVAAMDAPTAAAFAGSGAPAPDRLAAAERAAALGAWPPQRLAELYGKAAAERPAPADAPADGPPGETPLGRARLYAAAKADGDTARRVDALLQFLGAARRHDLYFVGAGLAAPVILAIGPGATPRKAAPDFIRALIAADHAREAATWLHLLEAPAADPVVTVAHAVDGAHPDEAAVAQSLAALARHGKDGGRARDLYLALLGAYGAALPSSDLASLIGPARPATLPSAAVSLDLKLASAAQRRGEEALAGLIMAQDGLQLTTEPFVLQEVLGSLRAAGFDVEARALARDAAVAAL